MIHIGGLDNLKDQLKTQSSQRENLVRTHFGLFVHCAEGLEWLKAYRRGGKRKTEYTTSLFVSLSFSITLFFSPTPTLSLSISLSSTRFLFLLLSLFLCYPLSLSLPVLLTHSSFHIPPSYTYTFLFY